MQHQRYVLLAFVALGVLVGLSGQAALSSAFEQFAVVDSRLGGVLNVSTLLSVLAGFATFGILIRNAKAVTFADEVVDELHKVTWPSREETIRAATTVVFATLFIAGLIGVYDLLWKNVADLFLFTEG